MINFYVLPEDSKGILAAYTVPPSRDTFFWVCGKSLLGIKEAAEGAAKNFGVPDYYVALVFLDRHVKLPPDNAPKGNIEIDLTDAQLISMYCKGE